MTVQQQSQPAAPEPTEQDDDRAEPTAQEKAQDQERENEQAAEAMHALEGRPADES